MLPAVVQQNGTGLQPWLRLHRIAELLCLHMKLLAPAVPWCRHYGCGAVKGALTLPCKTPGERMGCWSRISIVCCALRCVSIAAGVVRCIAVAIAISVGVACVASCRLSKLTQFVCFYCSLLQAW